MSDQADKAAENFENKLRRAFAQIESGKYESFDSVDDLITHLRNRSAAPSSALVEAATKLIKAQDEEDPRLFVIADKELRAALSAQEPKVCEWGFCKFNSTLNPNIYINCKNEPIVAMYYDLSAKPFCPYCGGVIKVKE